MKYGLLLLLGVLWSLRLAAMKSAGRSDIPPHVVVPVSILGIAVLYSATSAMRRNWPPIDRPAFAFYCLSGLFGFVLPFILEIMVSPRLPLFAFAVIISTMPILTTLLAAYLGVEELNTRRVCSVFLGFGAAVLILWDTAELPAGNVPWTWMLAALAVPALYAANTVFVAARWPDGVDALHVANAQALILSAAALAGGMVSGSIIEWHMAPSNMVVIGTISACEGLALLFYLKLTRDYGPTLVSLANFIALFMAAILGAVFFGDRFSWLSALAGLVLVAALIMRNQDERYRASHGSAT